MPGFFRAGACWSRHLRSKRALLPGVLLAATACAAAPAPAPAVHHDRVPYRLAQLNVAFGLRSFDASAWEPQEDQGLVGLDFAEFANLGNVWLEGGIHYSFDEEDETPPGGRALELDIETLELSAGLHAGLPLGRFQPYAGAGLSFLLVELEQIDQGVVVEDDDSTPGGYAKIGLLFAVAPGAHVGVEYRRFEGGDVSRGATELDTSSGTLALVFGASF